MNKSYAINSAHAEPFKKRFRRLGTAVLALTATLMTFQASAMEHARLDTDRAGDVVPLPAIPYLESMHWMRWKPRQPLLKIDTLLVPSAGPAPRLRIPSEYERALPSTT